MVHVVDRILLPDSVKALEHPDRCYHGEFSAADVMGGTVEFSALIDQMPSLKVLAEDPQTNATWFVPTDDGIEAALRDRNMALAVLMEDESASEVLAGHVVLRALPALRSHNNATTVTTLDGGEWTLVHSGYSFRLASASPFFDLGGAPKFCGQSSSANFGQPHGP